MFNLLFDSNIESRIDKNGRKYLFIKLKKSKPIYEDLTKEPTLYGYLLYNFEGRIKLKYILHCQMINKYSKKKFIKYSIWDQYIFEQHKTKINVIIKIQNGEFYTKKRIKAFITLSFDSKHLAFDKLFKYYKNDHNLKVIKAFIYGNLKEKNERRKV